MISLKKHNKKGKVYETFSLEHNDYDKCCVECAEVIGKFKEYPMKILVNKGRLGYFETPIIFEENVSKTLYDCCYNGDTTVVIEGPEEMVLNVDPFYEEISIVVKKELYKTLKKKILS